MKKIWMFLMDWAEVIATAREATAKTRLGQYKEAQKLFSK